MIILVLEELLAFLKLILSRVLHKEDLQNTSKVKVSFQLMPSPVPLSPCSPLSSLKEDLKIFFNKLLLFRYIWQKWLQVLRIFSNLIFPIRILTRIHCKLFQIIKRTFLPSIGWILSFNFSPPCSPSAPIFIDFYLHLISKCTGLLSPSPSRLLPTHV